MGLYLFFIPAEFPSQTIIAGEADLKGKTSKRWDTFQLWNHLWLSKFTNTNKKFFELLLT